MENGEDEEDDLRSVALQNAHSILIARQRAERELHETNQKFEQKTEELSRVNRRLSLLNRVANRLILAETPREQLKAVFQDVAAEIGAKFYFHYSVDENNLDALTLEISGGLEPPQERPFGSRPIG